MKETRKKMTRRILNAADLLDFWYLYEGAGRSFHFARKAKPKSVNACLHVVLPFM